MKFDIYIVGSQMEETLFGIAHSTNRKLVCGSVTYSRLKVKVREVLDTLALNGYDEGLSKFDAYEVYPAGATPDQFSSYNLLTEQPVPFYNEFLKVRLGTGNFDTHQRWRIK